MSRWAWRTAPDERVGVDRDDGQGFVVSTLNEVPGLAATRARVLEWLPLAQEKAAKYGVPVSWILAIITAESGGNPSAENYCCAGLMAIYYSVHGKTREQMLDPEQNVDYGTSLLARSRADGLDLPQAASVHVGGAKAVNGHLVPHAGTCASAVGIHPDFMEGSPWGLCEHMFPKTQADGSVGYIDRVTRASNMYLDVLSGIEPHPGPYPVPVPRPGKTFAKQLVPIVLGTALGYGLTYYGLPHL